MSPSSTHIAEPSGNRFLRDLGLDLSAPVKYSFRGYCLAGLCFTDINLRECDFTECDLSFAVFKGCELYRSVFHRSIVYVTQFIDCNLIRADFRYSYFYGVIIRGCDPKQALFGLFSIERQRRFGDVLSPDCAALVTGGIRDSRVTECLPHSVAGRTIYFREFQPRERNELLAEMYNTVKHVLRDAGYVKQAATYYLLQMRAETRAQPKLWPRVKGLFGEYVCGYGERPQWALAWLTAVWIVFAMSYLMLPILGPENGVRIDGVTLTYTGASIRPVFDALYFSAVTLTTLGYGDAVPTGFARTIVIAEVFLGVVLSAILVASIARRLIRD